VVEALEDRWVPSVTFDFSGRTLIINGSPHARNNIVINDTGDTGGAAIQVLSDGSVAGTFSGATFTTITVNGGSKTDKVTYNVTGGTQSTTRVVQAFLNGGNDDFTANLNASSVVGDGVVQGLVVFGGDGKDTLKVNANNGAFYGAGTAILANLQGGADKDDVSFNFSGSAITPTVTLFLSLDGGEGNDTVTANLGLQTPGFHVTGFPSPFATAPGGSAAQVRGSGGKDRLSFNINTSRPDATSFALIDGGEGRDTCTASGFVNLAVNCES
jgi:hypothetical protein